MGHVLGRFGQDTVKGQQVLVAACLKQLFKSTASSITLLAGMQLQLRALQRRCRHVARVFAEQRESLHNHVSAAQPLSCMRLCSPWLILRKCMHY